MSRRPGRVELEGADELEASRAAALRAVLHLVMAGRPAIRRATVYPIARGTIVVRLMTGSGWIPVIFAPSDWSDAAVLASRLQTALASTH